MVYAAVDAGEILGADAASGLRFRVFPGGVMVLTSEIATRGPTEYRFPHDPKGIHISAQYFLSGEASIVMGNGSTGFWSENGMSIIRSDTPGFRLRIEAGQTLRHVCVAMYHHNLSALHDPPGNPQMARLMSMAAPVDMTVPVPAGPGIREKALALHALSHLNGIAALKSEALAMQFLAEALELYSGLDSGSETPGQLMPWQRETARQIRQAIDARPLEPIAMEALFSRFGVGEAMAQRIFRAEVGVTLAAYLRRARLLWAKDALGQNESVKRIAFACGYAHIGNFTRAYRQEFGESPSETRRRSRIG